MDEALFQSFTARVSSVQHNSRHTLVACNSSDKFSGAHLIRSPICDGAVSLASLKQVFTVLQSELRT